MRHGKTLKVIDLCRVKNKVSSDFILQSSLIQGIGFTSL